MFADDTNLFYSRKDINALFLKVNNKLHKINQWFISNKLSLNIKKQIHFNSIQTIIHFSINQVYSPFITQSLIKYIENKMGKNISLLFKAKPFLKKQSRSPLYYSYTYSCTNYEQVWTYKRVIISVEQHSQYI